MRVDAYTRTILTLIAACLIVLTVNALTPRVRASDSIHCTGTLKANAWGGIESTIGGYNVDVTCD
jgi:hypothetical protein